MDSCSSATQQQVLRLIQLGGQVVGAAVVGVQLLHKTAVCGANRLGARVLLQPQDLQRLGARHGAGRPRSALALPTRLMIPRLVAVLRAARAGFGLAGGRSEEHTSELQSLMR